MFGSLSSAGNNSSKRVFRSLLTTSTSSLSGNNNIINDGDDDLMNDDDIASDTTALLEGYHCNDQASVRTGTGGGAKEDKREKGLYLRLRIRPSVATIPECEVTVKTSSTVGALRDSIRQKFSLDDAVHSLRLVYAGKLLAPDDALVCSFGVKSDAVVHAVVGPKAPSSASPSTPSAQQQTVVSSSSAVSASRPPRGFDVLMHSFASPTAGGAMTALSADQILAIRTIFDEPVTVFQQQQMTQREQESDEDFRFRAETEWMAHQGPRSEFRLNVSAMQFLSTADLLFQSLRSVQDAEGRQQQQWTENNNNANTINITTMTSASSGGAADQGNRADFFYGLLAGYVLGFLMVFCIWDRNISFSQKAGLVVGIILNLLGDMLTNRYAGNVDKHASKVDHNNDLYRPEVLHGQPAR
jgi:hypothetical protein